MTPDEPSTPSSAPPAEKLPPALIEVATASLKTLRFVAQNRRKVVEMLLTLPELGQDRALAARLAYIVWDHQGAVHLKERNLRAAYVEKLLNITRSPRAKASAEPSAGTEEPVADPEAGAPAHPAPHGLEGKPDPDGMSAGNVAVPAAGDMTLAGKVT